MAPDRNIFILRSSDDLGILECIYIDEDYDRLCRPRRGWIVIDIGSHNKEEFKLGEIDSIL